MNLPPDFFDEDDIDDEDISNAELVNQDSFLKLKAKNRHKEIRRRIFSLIVAILIIAILATICITVFLGLKKVEIKGNFRYTKEQIIEASGLDGSDNLITLDLKKAKRKIMKACPYISNVSFKIVLPSTVIITVDEDAPGYCAEIYGDYFLLSNDLRVISKHDIYEDIEVFPLPVIYIKLPEVKRAVAGEIIEFDKSSSFKHLLAFLEQIKNEDIYFNLNCIDITDRYHITLYANESKHKIAIGTTDNLTTKLKFVNKVIESEYDEKSIISLNVEKINQIVVMEYDKVFEYK